LYSVGFNYSTSKPNVKYFELEVFESDIINELNRRLDIPLSNIVFLFYKHLRKDNHGYQEIHSIIKTDSKEVKEIFRIEDLEVVFSGQSSLIKFIDLIATKQYDELIDKTKSLEFSVNKETVMKSFNLTDSVFGEMNKNEPFLLTGFKLNNKIVRYYGVQLRSKRNCEIRMDIDMGNDGQNLNEFEFEIE